MFDGGRMSGFNFLARGGYLWVVLTVPGRLLPFIWQIRYRARYGQVTCPQDEPMDSRCAVRDFPTAPRVEAFGLTR